MAQKLSQEALAVDAGVDVSFISQIENARQNPSLETVERLADALGVKFVDMFKAPSKTERPPKPLPSGRHRRS